MITMTSQITSLTVVYSTIYSDADQRKHQSSASLAFVWGIRRDRWIPRTKGQLRGKCFHLMTSSCTETDCHPNHMHDRYHYHLYIFNTRSSTGSTLTLAQHGNAFVRHLSQIMLRNQIGLHCNARKLLLIICFSGPSIRCVMVENIPRQVLCLAHS